MEWTKVELPPEMVYGDFGWLSSIKVLTCEIGGEMRVATYEQIDENSKPQWFSACSERWVLDRVLYWMPLPETPNSKKVVNK